MKISRESIQELQHIYQEEYGEPLSEQEAYELGQRLLTLFRIVSRPFPVSADPPQPPPPSHLDGTHAPGTLEEET